MDLLFPAWRAREDAPWRCDDGGEETSFLGCGKAMPVSYCAWGLFWRKGERSVRTVRTDGSYGPSGPVPPVRFSARLLAVPVNRGGFSGFRFGSAASCPGKETERRFTRVRHIAIFVLGVAFRPLSYGLTRLGLFPVD